MFVKPRGPRSVMIDGPTSFEIVIPAPRNPFAIAFLPFWLVGWAFGEVFAVRALLFSPPDSDAPGLFLVVWLTGWTAGGAFAIVAMLWSWSGRERITLTSVALTIRYELLQVGRSRAYDLAQVRNLRVSPMPYNPFDMKSGLRFWGIGGGPVAFDYGSSTVHVAGGVDESEASDIVAGLKRRHDFRAV